MKTNLRLIKSEASEKPKLDIERWMERYGNMMYRYTLMRVRDEDAAKEIVQNTLLAALEGRHTFQGRASEKSWLFAILKHKILDYFRSMKRKRRFEVNPDEDSDSNGSTFNSNGNVIRLPQPLAFDPQRSAENNELWEAMSCCLDCLSEKFRSVFVLREIEGVSSEEICRAFNIKPNNFWVIMHRAKNQLRQCLERNEYKEAS